MSELILVRHGQANFLGDDYDRLSERGVEQSRRLGRYWAGRGMLFDEVYSGPRQRQTGTAVQVGREMLAAGLGWPEPAVLDELDEYDSDGVLRVFVPMLARSEERIARLAEAHARASGDAEQQRRTFQLLFEAVTARWVRGEIESPEVESWDAFAARVERGLRRAMSGEGKGRRIAVFTSGGPISVAVQRAVRAPSEMAIEFNWRILNASLTGVVFSGERIALDCFNALPHIDDPALRTYR
ncbi:MAG: histidine phosphatase family protein [Acidobacteria bacterium]|nr:histidine phosphatase family protein [Acidobacteriota bacterium]